MARSSTRAKSGEDHGSIQVRITPRPWAGFATITVARGKRVEIQDLHSTNGTLVNGSSVRTSPLQPGDKIRIGRVELVFER